MKRSEIERVPDGKTQMPDIFLRVKGHADGINLVLIKRSRKISSTHVFSVGLIKKFFQDGVTYLYTSASMAEST